MSFKKKRNSLILFSMQRITFSIEDHKNECQTKE